MKKLVMALVIGLACVSLGACSTSTPSSEEPLSQQAVPIDWAVLQDSDLLPEPPSEVGTVEWNRTYGFTIDVTHVDKGAFDKYVQACRDKGFILNFATRDDYYSAFDKTGHKLTLELRDGSVLYINLMKPTDSDSSTSDDESSQATAEGSEQTEKAKISDVAKATQSKGTTSEEAEKPVNSAEDTILIKDSNYVVSNGFVYYVVELHNNRQDYLAEFVTIHVTGKNTDGTIVFNSDWMVTNLFPGSTTYWANQGGNGNCSESDTVEFSVSVDSQHWKKTDQTLPENLYTFSDVNISPDPYGFGVTATGEITLTQPFAINGYQDANSPTLVCVLKDEQGKLVAGFSGYVMSELQVRQGQPFELMSNFMPPSYSTVEMYANPWM